MSELYLEGFTQNRDLSWLKFNERVLNEAANTMNPILERVKFRLIYEKNLAEFIRVRIGSLNNIRKIDSLTRDTMSGHTSDEQIHYIWREIRIINEKAEIELDDKRQFVTIVGEAPARMMFFEKIGTKVKDNMFKLTYDSFIKGIKTYDELMERIEKFKENNNLPASIKN